jgi:hypothetical protein
MITPTKWLTSGQLEALKWVALITMVVDHYGFLFAHPEFRLLGRWAFPIFALLIGYHAIFHSSDRKAYIKRLLILGLVSQPLSIWVLGVTQLNILFTLAIGLQLSSTLPASFNPSPTRTRNLIASIALLLVAPFTDYGPLGVFLVTLAALPILHVNPLRLIIISTLVAALSNAPSLPFCLATLTWVIPLEYISRWSINIPRGPKYLFYLFYPAHLLLLQLLIHVFDINH